MSRSAKTALTFALILAAAILFGGIMLSRGTKRPDTQPKEAAAAELAAADVRHDKISVSQKQPRRLSGAVNARTTHPRSVGVHDLAIQKPDVLPPLSGYIVDQFENWTSIPAGYRAEGLAVRDGAITLVGDKNSTNPRMGQLVSPPIPLNAPALAGSADNAAPIKDGASVRLQISLSDNGKDWSPWVSLDRYTKPDGNRVAAPMQASLANADLTSMDRDTSITATGPSLRYRLYLSAGGVVSPSVSDVRIWKRE